MERSGDIIVSERLVLPNSELLWRYSASGGPGGQHANTSNTRAEVTFDITESAVLDEAQRQRLVDQFGRRVSVSADDTRSQYRNRQLAAQRLAARLRGALQVEAERRPTKPGRGARERRLREKRHQSERKAHRQVPRDE
jgi:ribosome-associated protein